MIRSVLTSRFPRGSLTGWVAWASLTRMCNCLDTCLYTCRYTCLYTRLDTCLYTCPHECLTHACVRVYIHVGTHVEAHVYTHIYLHVCTHVGTYVYACLNTCLNTSTERRRLLYRNAKCGSRAALDAHAQFHCHLCEQACIFLETCIYVHRHA